MWDSLIEVGRNLQRRPFQSLLSVLGILAGMAGVLVLGAMSAGIHHALDTQVAAIGPGMMSVAIAPSSSNPADVPMTMQDATAVSRAVSGKALETPVAEEVVNISGSAGTASGYLVGVNGAFPSIDAIAVKPGRFFSPVAALRGGGEAVLGQGLVRQLFGRKNPVGRQIAVQGNILTVAGVFQYSNAASTSASTDIVLVPIATYMTQFAANSQVSTLLLRAYNPGDVDQVKELVLGALERDHGWRLPVSSLQVATQSGILKASQSLEGLFSMFVTGAIYIAFVVGGIGIVNVMLMAVADRRREIGLFLAFGARPQAVLLQFMLEAVIVSLLGTVGGLLAGTFGGLLLMQHGVAVDFMPATYLQDLGIGILLGVLFGFYPSLRASRVTPIRAIHE